MTERSNDIPSAQDAVKPLERARAGTLLLPRSRIRVVVADDSDALRRGIADLLGTECEVTTALPGGAGLIETVSAMRPDVAVVDIALSGKSSLDTIRAISEKSPSTKVVVFSAYKEQACVRAARNAGARAYVFKSAPRTLISSIRAVARGELRFPDSA